MDRGGLCCRRAPPPSDGRGTTTRTTTRPRKRNRKRPRTRPPQSSRLLPSSHHHPPVIVFASASRYDVGCGGVLLLPFVALGVVALLCVDDVHTLSQDYQHSSTVWVLGWSSLLILGLYLTFLPRHLDVRSTGTVAIKTSILTFHFDAIARATYDDGNEEGEAPPQDGWPWSGRALRRIRCATSCGGTKVLLQRTLSSAKWDVLLTPHDAEGFITAVTDMVQQRHTVDNTQHNRSA